MNVKLTDLDELVQIVRDKTSRSYIMEAVNAYRSGAYRAAIVSTWIAVVYDIISKLRELSNSGDKEASKLVSEMDNYIENKDIRSFLKYEDNLLQKAHNSFEFLTPYEYSALTRLKEDRHLCAHPAFTSENILFQPTPEVVRTHIVHAVLQLLQHRPVQGKAALQNILDDIKQPTFPSDLKDVSVFLNDRYFNRAKDVLVRNLIIVLAKELLKSNDPELKGKERNLIHTLIVISGRYHNIYKETMSEQLPKIAETLKNDQLMAVFRLLKADLNCWHMLAKALQIQIKQLLELKAEEENATDIILFSYDVFNSIHIKELEPIILKSFDNLDPRKQEVVIWENSGSPHPKFVEKAVELYLQASNNFNAEEIGNNILLPLARYFSPDQIKKILIDGVKENVWITEAEKTPEILKQLFKRTINHLDQTRDVWQNIIRYLDETDEPEYNSAYSKLRKQLQPYGID